jgi:hypothetical protein
MTIIALKTISWSLVDVRANPRTMQKNVMRET